MHRRESYVDRGYSLPDLTIAFDDYVSDAFSTKEPWADTVCIGDTESNEDVAWLLGQLWSSADLMPVSTCRHLNLPEGSSYGRGAQTVAKLMNEGKPAREL